MYIRNIERFKLSLSQSIIGDIKTIIVKRHCSGNWYVYFSCGNVPKRKYEETEAVVGIDVGIDSFAVDDYDHKINNPIEQACGSVNQNAIYGKR